MITFLTPFIKKVLKYLFVTVTDRNIILAKNDTPSVDDTYLILLNDVGTVHTYKAGSRQGIRGEMVKYESKYYIAVRLQELGCALVSVPVSYVRRG